MCERTCARDREIEVNMTVKKEMSPDTVIKLRFDPSDTADVVYQRFNAKVQEVKNVLEDTSFGALAGAFHLVPGLLLKFLVWALQVSDYFGCLPSSITHLSHFHGSLYITFMASLGIPPIFHRLYDFGNVPVFWSFGRKRQAFEYQWVGTVAGEVGGLLLRYGRVGCGRILFRGRHAQFSESDPRSLAAGRAAGGGRAGSALI